MLYRFYQFFASVKLAVVLLALGLILVFWGTMAQVKFGLYQAQSDFFRSLFIYWKPEGSSWRVPIFPGGYLVGGLLLINLLVAHLRYYRPGLKRLGIAMIHLGVVLLLLGQFATDMLSTESYMRIHEGQSANFSESSKLWELAAIDGSDAREDKVIAIPSTMLVKGEEISRPELPFILRTKEMHANSAVQTNATSGFDRVEAGNLAGGSTWWRGLQVVTTVDDRDVPSALLELKGPQDATESIFISGHFAPPANVTAGGKTYQMAMRPTRYYKPFSLYLIDFRFDRYPGTQIPKNFSSRVRLNRPDTGEERELTIRMNEPLRYNGETFFQSSYDEVTEQTTVLQVVDNPSWLTPYFACLLVALGMIWQFTTHLVVFAAKRRIT